MSNFPRQERSPLERRPFTPNREPPLIKLVEKYLAENSNLSFVNVDDMIDSLQGRVFRFARLKRQVFANMVRKAYREFCQINNGTPGANRVPPEEERPSRVDPPKEEDVDSDIEVEEYQSKSDVVNSHLTNLYATSTPRNTLLNPKANKEDPPPSKVDSSSGNKMPDTSSSSSVISGGVAKHSKNAESTEKSLLDESDSEDVPDTQDSDNDLEIIDEVKGDGVIRMTSDNNVSSLGDTRVTYLPNNITVTRAAVGAIGVGDCQVPRSFVVSSSSLAEAVNALNSSEGKPRLLKGLTVGRSDTIPLACSSKPFANNVSNAIVQNKYNLAQSHISIVPVDMSSSGKGTKRKAVSPSGVDDDFTPKKSKKEVFVIQDSGYRLSDFAGSEKVVEEVCRLLMHLKHPEVYKTLGVTAPRGFLLHGPPGTGKTLLANAIAGELQLPMLKVTGTEFISGISGESENNIRDLFSQAVAISPCIIFIDEIDSITPKRENAQREMERRVVAQLLSCVDDLMNHAKGNQVLLIGATNRIEAIDTALRRAGRFDREICLGIPDEKSRQKILAVICRNLRLAPGFDLNLLAKLTPGYVGADLQALVREAAVQAVNKALISSRHKEPDAGNGRDTSCNENIVETSSFDDVIILPEPTVTKASSKESENIKVVNTDPSTDKSEEDSRAVQKEEGINVVPNGEKESEVQVLNEGEAEVTLVVDKNVDAETAPKILTENKPDTEEEKMEVDSTEVETKTEAPTVPAISSTSSESCTTVDKIHPTNELNVGSDIMQVDANSTDRTARCEQLKTGSDMQVDADVTDHITISPQSVICDDDIFEEPSYLRWIKETAPLPKHELDELYIFMDDFEIALKYVQPSSKREGFATVPDTTWDDIGALKDIREELEVSILGPVKHSSAFQMLGLNTPAGVLLCGPPGCGKTLLAKAVANEAGINFISVKGPELLNMYVGESERAVRQCFLRAKNSSPCVIFFDELDALCPRRSDSPESGSGSRIVNQLLTEMDGMESRAGVFVMAATNRPDIIDPAILRPGRLDKILFVDLPTASDRFEILKAITKEGTKPVLASDVNMKEIAENDACENYTGADLAALVREASIAAFRDLILSKNQDSRTSIEDLKVSARHFETAFVKTKPSVTRNDRTKYAAMKERYSSVHQR